MGSSTSDGGGGFFDPARMVQDLFVETDFDAESHPDMEKMIDAADPRVAENLGAKLTKAAKTIDQIGNHLKAHKDRVDWEGQGGDAFREWVTQMSSATLRLGELSKTAGESLRTIAQTLHEVKRDMPKYSESSKSTLDSFLAHNPAGMLSLSKRQPEPTGSKTVLSGPSQSDAYDASQKLTEDHGEAVRQMRKLAQSYSMSSAVMGQTEAPTFPPMPRAIMPPPPRDRGERPEGNDTGPGTGPRALAADTAPAAHGSAVGSPDARPDQQVGTHLAGGVAMPEAPSAPHGGGALPVNTPGGGGAPGGATPVPSAPVPMAPRPSAPVSGPAGRSGTARPGAMGGNRVPGVGGQNVGRPPVATGRAAGAVNPGARPGARLPGDHGNGIYGGRATASGTGQSARGLPRGNVVGSEPGQGQMGRTPGTSYGRAVAGGTSAGTGANPSGVVGGRPLASQPGGGRQRPSTSNGRPFTPGGTGLVREGTPGAAEDGRPSGRAEHTGGRGPAGGPRPAGPGDPREQNGQRPDYLVEDEETWQRNERRAAPPVIE